MAICKMQARWIVKDHLAESLKGKKIVTLGRQSIWMSLKEAVQVCEEEGYVPSKETIEILGGGGMKHAMPEKLVIRYFLRYLKLKASILLIIRDMKMQLLFIT